MELNYNSTLIILDWDDTLFPTSWVNKNNIEIMSKDKFTVLYNKFFKNLDILLEKLFKLLIKCGTVMIITNALLNWIEISSLILPKLNIILKNKKIKIISARGDYTQYNNDPMIWKKLAFQKELNDIIHNKIFINNVISIGDAEYEYVALINLYKNDAHNFKLLKAIKFIRYPDINQISIQVELLTQSIIKICKEPAHVDLEFTNYS